jgi:hypothetical protein
LAVSTAFGQTQPVLTIGFDGDFHGVGPNGPVAGTPEGKPEWVPGKVGQALKSGPTLGFVHYPTAGLLNRHAGTVEMWVCPLDWTPDDAKFHVFFETRGEGFLCLYKYWVGTNLLMLTCDHAAGPYSSSQYDVGGWKPGEWHHIAGTWSAAGVLAYVDGQPASQFPLPGSLPRALGDTFQIGDRPWQFERTTASLVDEVRIYDRALTPRHIAAHYTGNYDLTVPLTAETTQLDYQIDCLAGNLQVRLDTAGADVEDACLNARFTIVPKGPAAPARSLATSATSGFTGGQALATLPLPSQPGPYEVIAGLLRDGQRAFELRRDLTIPTSEWLGNNIGLEDQVLPPWTPLVTAGSGDPRRTAPTVSCWGRDYSFGSAALPTQIQSAGARLLTRPIGLSGTAIAQVGGRRVLFNTRIQAEYDGLLGVEIACGRADRLPLEGLTLEIPLRAEHALYRHLSAPDWEKYTGAVPAGRGVVDHLPYTPYVWLGDNDRGLFWFCESAEMWPNSQSENAIEIVRSGQQVVLRLNLLAAGQKLPADWEFVFGLQATPVKPLPRNWRRWRMSPGRSANVEIVWPTPTPDSLRYFGYPEAADPELFQKHVDDLHARGLKAAPYLCLTYIATPPPEWQYYRKVWEMGPVDSSPLLFNWNHIDALASPVGPGFADFIVWKNKEFVDRYGLDGLYHDCTGPYTSANLDAGLGYRRDGRNHETCPLLGYRALYRRVYAMMKALPRETFTQAHMSSKVMIPALAYEDSYLDGEHLRGRVKDSYLEVLPLDTFRAEFMGRQWGVMPFFIPEFDAEQAKQVEPTRGLMALLMLHDVSPWPIWCNVAVVNEAFAALDEFGYVDADFIPYFDPIPPATTDLKEVYNSAYRRADGRALLIVGNLSREDRQGEIRINAHRLGIPLGQVRSWPDKQPVKAAEGRLPLTVPGLGYRMLVVARP